MLSEKSYQMAKILCGVQRAVFCKKKSPPGLPEINYLILHCRTDMMERLFFEQAVKSLSHHQISRDPQFT